MKRWSAIVIVLTFAAALFVAVGLPRYAGAHKHGAGAAYMPVDFTIFYCAGAALNAGANPYALEPLRSCEARLWPPGYAAGFAEPSLAPGYVLPIFAAFARLPFVSAAYLWLALSCFAFGVAVLALYRISHLPPIAIFALLFVPVGMHNVHVGQLAPFFVATLSLCAWSLVRHRQRLAALCAVCTLIEPHVGLAAIVGVFVFAPRARIVIALGTLILAALHVAVLGWSTAIAYFTTVLPAMVTAEITAADQYGVAWCFHYLGLSAQLAARAATVVSFIALVASLFVVPRAVRNTRSAAAMLTIPVCASLLFAAFMHDIELGAAIVGPLAAMTQSAYTRTYAVLAMVIAVPWFATTYDPLIALASIASSAVFTFTALLPEGSRRAGIAALGAAAAVVVLIIALRRLPMTPGTAQPTASLPATALAAESWGAYLRAQPRLTASGAQVVVSKSVTLVAIGAFLIFAIRTSARGRIEVG